MKRLIIAAILAAAAQAAWADLSELGTVKQNLAIAEKTPDLNASHNLVTTSFDGTIDNVTGGAVVADKETSGQQQEKPEKNAAIAVSEIDAAAVAETKTYAYVELKRETDDEYQDTLRWIANLAEERGMGIFGLRLFQESAQRDVMGKDGKKNTEEWNYPAAEMIVEGGEQGIIELIAGLPESEAVALGEVVGKIEYTGQFKSWYAWRTNSKKHPRVEMDWEYKDDSVSESLKFKSLGEGLEFAGKPPRVFWKLLVKNHPDKYQHMLKADYNSIKMSFYTKADLFLVDRVILPNTKGGAFSYMANNGGGK